MGFVANLGELDCLTAECFVTIANTIDGQLAAEHEKSKKKKG